MIRGTLVINLNPAYIGFSQNFNGFNAQSRIYAGRESSVTEIRDLLIDIGAITPEQQWPPAEFVLRLPLVVPKAALSKLGLLSVEALDPLPAESDPRLRLIS